MWWCSHGLLLGVCLSVILLYTADGQDELDGTSKAGYAAETTTTRTDVEDLEPVVRDFMKRIRREMYPLVEELLFDPEIPEACSSAFTKIIRSLSAGNLWAEQFIFSSGGPPAMFEGQFASLGLYDSCLNAQPPPSSDGNVPFTGKYCTVFIIINNPYITKLLERGMHHYKVLEVYTRNDTNLFLDYMRVTGMRLGVCIPSTCNGQVIEYAVQKLGGKYGMQATARGCRAISEDPPVSVFQKTVIALAVGLATLAIVATILDRPRAKHVSRSNGKSECPYLQNQAKLNNSSVKNSPAAALCWRVLNAFSLSRNWTRVFNLKSSSADSKYLACIHGIRVISSIYVLWGHVYLFSDPTSSTTPFIAMNWFRSITFVPIYMGFFVVDTFFCISGLLTYTSLRKELNKPKAMSVFRLLPLALVRRWLRLVVPCMAIVAFSFVWPLLLSGPLKDLFMETILRGCRERWWSIPGMFNNIYPIQDQCALHLWYVGVDFQLTLCILLPLVLVLRPTMARHVGTSILCLMLVASCVYTFVETFAKGYPPIILPLPTFLFKLPSMLTRIYLHCVPHLASSVIGIFFGHLIEEHRAGKYKMPAWNVTTCWILVTVICVVTYYIPFYWQFGGDAFTGWAALWSALIRPIWALGVGWVIFACAVGHGGPVRVLLSQPVFIPLSRLSYSFYMVHVLVVMSRLMTQRALADSSHYFYTKYVLSDVVISYFFATIMYLLVEGPTNCLVGLSQQSAPVSKHDRDGVNSTEQHCVDVFDSKMPISHEDQKAGHNKTIQAGYDLTTSVTNDNQLTDQYRL